MLPLYPARRSSDLSVRSWVAEAVPAPINAMSAAAAIAARARFLIHFTGYSPFVDRRGCAGVESQFPNRDRQFGRASGWILLPLQSVLSSSSRKVGEPRPPESVAAAID